MITRARKGFTLLELIVVLVILGLLAAIAIPTYQSIITAASESSAKETAKAVGRDIVAMAALNQASPRSATYVTAAAGEVTGATVAASGQFATDNKVCVTSGGVTATIVLPAAYSGSVGAPTIEACPT